MAKIRLLLLISAASSLLVLGTMSCGGASATNAGATQVTTPDATITAPAANVTIHPGDAVTFTGTATDPNNLPVTVVWDFGDGSPTSTLLSPGSHTYSTVGTYTVTLTATSSQGLVDPTPATRTVTVQANQPPNATITSPATDVTIVAGQSVSFTGTVTDPENDAVTVVWNFGDGSATSTLLSPGNHTYAAVGVYTVTLTATDALGAVDPTPATRIITVQANGAPNGVITSPAANTTIYAGQSVTFAGTATDPNSNPVTVVWDFGDGSATSTSLSPGAHTYAAVGTYTVTFTATDSLGLTDPTPDTRTITVQTPPANLPPDSTITSPAANVTITAGQSVTFAGTATDPNGDPTTVLWNFGDGSATSTLLSPGAHTYATAGTYTVTFTATDSHGLADPTPATRTITVNTAAATLTQVQAAVFNSCTGCHGGSSPTAGMNLTAGSAYSNLVNVQATTYPAGTLRVVPFSSATSALVIQLAGGHRSVSTANQNLIKSWIDAGALNN